MLTTADIRGRCSALPSSPCSRFGLLAAPADAARGVYRCTGSLDDPADRRSSWRPPPSASSASSTPSARAAASKPLRRDGDLAQAARGHAADMARRNSSRT